MSAKQFFKKVGGDIENAFKKTGKGLKATFKKGGYIDKGLGKVADVAKQVGKFAGKAGGVISELAPVASMVPGIGPELAVGLAGAGTLAKKIGGTAGRVQRGVAKAQDVKNQTVKNVGKAIRGESTVMPTLEKPQPQEDMIGLAGMGGIEFE